MFVLCPPVPVAHLLLYSMSVTLSEASHPYATHHPFPHVTSVEFCSKPYLVLAVLWLKLYLICSFWKLSL